MGISYRAAASVGIPSAEGSTVESLHSLSSKLLVQFGDVVVPRRLVTASRHRGSQVVFLPEGLDLELATAISRAIGEHFLGARQLAWLLVDQPYVPVKTWGGQQTPGVLNHKTCLSVIFSLSKTANFRISCIAALFVETFCKTWT